MEPAGKAHVFVADVDQPELDDHDRHHLERVLRLRPGDQLTVADGAGRWRLARFGAAVEAAGPVETDDRPEPEITIAFALVKGGRPELVVQKLTEIGVDRIVPFVAERSVVHWDDDKAARNHARLSTVAREAGMQSRRSWLPEVEPVALFAEVAARPGAALTDRAGARPGLDRRCLLVGPEGGWTDSERAADLPVVGLGPTVLRAETAAIVAGAVLCGFRSILFAPIDRHGG
jgi:16S rRNA (uracil1498-N3)-methyltransferase